MKCVALEGSSRGTPYHPPNPDALYGVCGRSSGVGDMPRRAVLCGGAANGVVGEGAPPRRAPIASRPTTNLYTTTVRRDAVQRTEHAPSFLS